MGTPRNKILALAAVVILTTVSGAAKAYIGPGAGLSAIGTIVALIGAVFLVIAGFVWYPVKRLMRKRTETRESTQERDEVDQS